MTVWAIGNRYSRAEIHSRLGGGVQDYLPHRDGEVVCGCFSPKLNPAAPQIILPGNGPGIKKWAEVFAEQPHFVPVFLKRATNEWEYAGDYRVKRRTEDPNEIAQHAKRTGRNDISQVLFLEQSEQS